MNQVGSVPPARTALVTGAGSGIGRALATGLGRAGLSVALVGRRRGPLDETAEAAAAAGAPATAVVEADVRDMAAVIRAVAVAEAALGPLDLLVNNAGVIERDEVPVWEADPAQWWDVVETDLRGPFHCVRAVVPAMVARGGGRVIDLNSGAGAADREVYSAYCAAKAGLFRIAGSLDLAGRSRGLRVFELAPGVVRSAMTAGMRMHDDRSDWTPVEAVVELAVAAAAGRLDAWSGCYLRAGVDTPESLAAAEAAHAVEGRVPPPFRRLAVVPWPDGDPLPG